MKYLISLLLLFIFSSPVFAQNGSNGALNVYMDCSGCDMSYIRTELPQINYVIDRKLADIYLLINRPRTSGGGRKYILTFWGEDIYKNISDTLSFDTSPDATDDETREQLVRMIKIGLMPYFTKTSLIDYVDISFRDSPELLSLTDNWNYWRFRTRIRGHYFGEKSRKSLSISGYVSADRITKEWKIRSSASYDYSEDRFESEEDKIFTYQHGQRIRGLVVKSLGEHFSAGASGYAYTSSYSNIEYATSFAPAIEINLFPYSEFNYHELRVLFELAYKKLYYSNITIYDKLKEDLFQGVITVDFEVEQQWGEIDLELQGSQYLHDSQMNRIDFKAEFSFRLFKGFSLDFHGGFAMIHDQISLPKGTVSTEELLLQRQELETQYQTWSGIGFSYTFGSLYANIVNPRFGY